MSAIPTVNLATFGSFLGSRDCSPIILRPTDTHEALKLSVLKDRIFSLPSVEFDTMTLRLYLLFLCLISSFMLFGACSLLIALKTVQTIFVRR